MFHCNSLMAIGESQGTLDAGYIIAGIIVTVFTITKKKTFSFLDPFWIKELDCLGARSTESHDLEPPIYL